jgi:hypothetical protein
MFTHRAEAERRQKRRRSGAPRASTPPADLTEVEIPSLPPRRVFQEPPLPSPPVRAFQRASN